MTERSGLAGTRYDFGAAVGDYDNDGDVDLHVTGLGGNTLYRNSGSGTFTDVTASAGAAVPGWSSSAAFVDYDHDGRLDLYVGRYLDWTWESNPVCPSADGTGRAYCHPKLFAPVASVLLRNNGDGTFSDVSAASGIAAHPGKALGVAIHDLRPRRLHRPLRRQRFDAAVPLPEHAAAARSTKSRSRPASPTTTMGGALPGWAPISRTTTTMAGRTYS